jgi:hypothetical protein
MYLELQDPLVHRFQSLELQQIMQVEVAVEVGLTPPTVDLVEQVVVDKVVEKELEDPEPRELQTLEEAEEQVLFQLQQVAQVDLEL